MTRNGQTTPNGRPDQIRAAGNFRSQEASIVRNQGIVAAIADVARHRNATPAQVAPARVLSLGEDIVPIPGTRHLTRLKENHAAADLRLTAANLEALAPSPTTCPVTATDFAGQPWTRTRWILTGLVGSPSLGPFGPGVIPPFTIRSRTERPRVTLPRTV